MHLLRSVWSEVLRDPLRASLTVVGMSLGVAIVTVTVNVGDVMLGVNRAVFSTPGSRVVVAAAEADGPGRLSYEGVEPFTLRELEAIRTLVPSVRALTPVTDVWLTPEYGADFRSITVGDKRYETRLALLVDPEYATVYGLRLVGGAFFTTADVEEGHPVVVISESTAAALFGSAGSALGQSVTVRQQREGRRILADYEIVGVFADVTRGLRETYGIADILVPVDSPPHFLVRFAVLSSDPDAGRVASQLVDAVRSLRGPDAKVTAWVGHPLRYGETVTKEVEESRSIALFLDSFGALALLIAATGILTMMMVGVVERSRAVGLRRTVGCTRAGIVVWLVGEAALLAVVSAAAGLGLAALSSGPVMTALGPALPGGEQGLPSAIRPMAAATGALSAVAAAVLFGLAPAIVASRVSPVEATRDS